MREGAALKTVDLVNPSTEFINRLPDMSGVVERLFRHFRTNLFQEFRLNVQAVEGGFSIVTHDEFLAPRPGYHLYGILNAAPIRGLSLIMLEGTLLAAIVDDLLGAGGPTDPSLAKPAISVMETRIGRRLMDMLIEALGIGFEQYFTTQCEILRTEGFAALASVGDASEPFCVMSARVTLPTGEGRVSIALPYRGLEPYGELLGSPAGGQAELEARSQWVDRLTGAIDGLPLEISFEIGRIPMSALGLAALSVGDVLPLTLHRNAKAMIGDTAIAEITYGAVGSNFGVYLSHDRQDQ